MKIITDVRGNKYEIISQDNTLKTVFFKKVGGKTMVVGLIKDGIATNLTTLWKMRA